MAPRLHRRLATLIDSWIDEYRLPQRDLSAFRVLYALLALGMFWDRATWTASLPPEWYRPQFGLGHVLGSWPDASLVVLLNVALTVSLLALSVGVRCSGLVAACLMLVLNAWCYSTGKVDHDVLLILVPLCLEFSGWSGRGSVRPWSVLCLALCVGLAMSTAGYSKLAADWLDPSTQATRGHLVYIVHSLGVETPLARSILSIRSPWLWESADWFAVGMELAFPLAVLRLSWFRWMLGIACLFHLGVWLSFGIPFAPNIVAYLAFFPLANLRRVLLPTAPVAVLLLGTLGLQDDPQRALYEVVTVFGALSIIASLFHKTLKPTPGPP